MWDDLTMQQRADVISISVKAGLRDIDSIRSFYDKSLSKDKHEDGGELYSLPSNWSMVEESKYLDWRNNLPKNLRNTDDQTYDMRRAYRAGMQPILEKDGYHLQSRDPKTGRILKMPSHPTYLEAIFNDARMGYYPKVDNKGVTYTDTWEGNKFQQGGGLKGGKKRGDKVNTEQCATWSNGLLRDNGYLISGNAWGLNHVNTLFNGFDGLDKPSSYDKEAIETYNHNAAGNVYNNFDSKTLDKSKPYVVNMYFNGSHSQEEAYKDGKGVTGTHTGILTHDGNHWNVTHNIYGTIHEEPFISLQRGDNTYGVTAVYEPRKDNLFNRVRGALGFADGGNLSTKQIGKKQIEFEDKEYTDWMYNWLSKRRNILKKKI